MAEWFSEFNAILLAVFIEWSVIQCMNWRHAAALLVLWSCACAGCLDRGTASCTLALYKRHEQHLSADFFLTSKWHFSRVCLCWVFNIRWSLFKSWIYLPSSNGSKFSWWFFWLLLLTCGQSFRVNSASRIWHCLFEYVVHIKKFTIYLYCYFIVYA